MFWIALVVIIALGAAGAASHPHVFLFVATVLIGLAMLRALWRMLTGQEGRLT